MQKNLAGKIFGRLTVVSLEPQVVWIDTMNRRGVRPRKWLCHCACGKDTKVRADRLLEGKTRSCGCLHTDIARATGEDRAHLVEQSTRARVAIASHRSDHEPIPLLPAKLGADARHGLPQGTYASMFAAQGGVCLICGSSPPEGLPLHLDHDHATQQVRGLLCNGCNAGLGCFKDSILIMAKAMKYLTLERPVLLSSRKEDNEQDDERRKAYRDRVASWETVRWEKESLRLQKHKERLEAQAVRKAQRAALVAAASVRRQELYRVREMSLAETLQRWDALEQERKVVRIARRDAKRSLRAAERARVKMEREKELTRNPVWAAEFEAAVNDLTLAPPAPLSTT